MLSKIKKVKHKIEFEIALPKNARNFRKRDYKGLPNEDPGSEACIAACLDWLMSAQELSGTDDGGYARNYHLIKENWASSYPETTGYIIPTLLDCAERYDDHKLRDSAIKALDWCVNIQLENGGFQGGTIDALPVVPVTFNTGQILIGLAAGAKIGEAKYHTAMTRAADWLVETLDADGCWREHATPFAVPGEKAYETHVSWGLFEAAKIEPNRSYGETGLKQVKWALTKQQPNGWFSSNCLQQPDAPLTHTIGYVLRGIIEGYVWSKDQELYEAAHITAMELADIVDEEGFLPGRLDKNWCPTVDWACLTGSVQIAACLFILNDIKNNAKFLSVAKKLTSYVRRTIQLDASREHRGGVRGAFPIDGAYGEYQYLNWAAKFFIDAAVMDIKASNGEPIIAQ